MDMCVLAVSVNPQMRHDLDVDISIPASGASGVMVPRRKEAMPPLPPLNSFSKENYYQAIPYRENEI